LENEKGEVTMWRGLRERLDYEGIKALAAETNRSVSHLLTLSNDHDPFYAGLPSSRERAEWFARVWERFGGGAGYLLRRLHYQLISSTDPPLMPDGETYLNTEKCWNYLGGASSSARHLELVPAEDFVDRRNPDHRLNAVYQPPEEPSWAGGELYSWSLPTIRCDLHNSIHLSLPEVRVDGYGYTQADQPFHLEIWIEKSTMNDVLEPLCRRLGINLITSIGFQSITSAIQFLSRLEKVRRIIGEKKPARIFYLSDYDPAGVHMPSAVARMVEFYLDRYAPGADIKLTPLVLTERQVKQYRLPRTPIKESDLRKGKFEDRHGEGAVELDALEALHPGELAQIVRSAVARYIDEDIGTELDETAEEAQEAAENTLEEAFSGVREELDEIEEEARTICEKYERQLLDLNKQLQQELAPLAARLEASRHVAEEKVGNLEIDLPDRPVSSLESPNEDDWLFDSGRDYLEQMAAYKAAKKTTMERTVIERTCKVCGSVFVAKRSHALVCSRTCREAGRSKKRKEARKSPKKKPK
jgi:hypothetical protein